MEQFTPIIAAALAIGLAGEVAKKAVNAGPGDRGWRRAYFVTFKAHALVVGALVGAGGFPFGLPVPGAFGDAVGGSVLAYVTAGALAMTCYSAIVGNIKNLLAKSGS